MVKPVPARQPLIRHRDRLAVIYVRSRPQLANPCDRARALAASLAKGAQPAELRRLLDSLSAGHGLYLYLPP
jgi:hypothetical protein